MDQSVSLCFITSALIASSLIGTEGGRIVSHAISEIRWTMSGQGQLVKTSPAFVYVAANRPQAAREERVNGVEPTRDRGRVLRRPPFLLGAALALVLAAALRAAFGPNVYVSGPGMRQSRIETTVNSIARRQARNQFGTQRYALLFEPGTY